jgi:hypothetical protein
MTASDEMRELRELAELYRFDLFMYLRHLTDLDAPVCTAEVDDVSAVGTVGVGVHFKLCEGLKALLLTLRARNSNADEIEGRTCNRGAFPNVEI